MASRGDDESPGDASDSSESTASSPTSAEATASPVGQTPPTSPMSAEDAAVLDEAAQLVLDSSAGELPGLWLGVGDPDKGVQIAAYGEAETGGAAATVDDKGRIGSISKTFTSAAILEQVASGALALDDTVADVVPDLAAEAPPIADVTVEQLLSMHNGLPEYEPRVVPEVLADPTQPIDPHDIIVSTVDEQGVSDPPEGVYSTANYLILGEMLEQLTGQPIDAVLTDLAQRAGLTDTALQPIDEIGMPDPSSHGYANAPAADDLNSEGIATEPLGDVSGYSTSWGGSSGAMYSTVEDLGTWAATGFGNSLLPPELVSERLDSEPIDVGNYGLGLLTFDDDWYGHLGEILGWESIALYQPSTGAVFVAIVNESGSIGDIGPLATTAFADLGTVFGG